MEDEAMNLYANCEARPRLDEAGESSQPAVRACDFTLAEIDEYLTNSRTFNRPGWAVLKRRKFTRDSPFGGLTNRRLAGANDYCTLPALNKFARIRYAPGTSSGS